jgi:nucleotide-binding universal stress UspA family protein
MVFKRILLPINKSNKSLKTAKKAINLAKKLNTKLIAIYVLNTRFFAGTIPTNQIYAYKYYKDIKYEKREEAHNYLNKIEELGNAKNIDIQTILVEGNPEKKILHEAKKNDLIILNGKKTSTLNRVFLTSLPEKILHNAKSTIMIIK